MRWERPPLLSKWHAPDGFSFGEVTPGRSSAYMKRPENWKSFVFGAFFNNLLAALSGKDDFVQGNDL